MNEEALAHWGAVATKEYITYYNSSLGQLASSPLLSNQRSYVTIRQRYGLNESSPQNCPLPSYYAASSSNSLPAFRDNLLVSHIQGSKIQQQETSSRNNWGGGGGGGGENL